MNKRVLQTSIILILGILAFQYIIKIFFPQEFIFIISTPFIIEFGLYVDNHLWANALFNSIFTFAGDFLFICAITKQKSLKIKQLSIIFVDIAISALFIIIKYDGWIYTYYTFFAWLIMALICKADLKSTIIIYSIHSLAQLLSLNIRDISMYVSNYNFAVFILLAIECYFWLLLFYCLNNYKKENKIMGAIKPFYGEGVKYWAEELVKALAKNDTEAIQECLRQLSLFIKNEEKD